MFSDVPTGLNVGGLGQYLREHGTQVSPNVEGIGLARDILEMI
jgi:hypothetical protein